MPVNAFQVIALLLFVGISVLVGYLTGSLLPKRTTEWDEMVKREKFRERQRLEIKEALQRNVIVSKETP